MSKKQKIALIFMELQSKIGYVFADDENEINWEVHDLLAGISMKLDEAMALIAELEGVKE